MKATIDNLNNPNNKPEEFEFEFDWIGYITFDKIDKKTVYTLLFTEKNFMPEFDHRIREDHSEEFKNICKTMVLTPGYKALIDELHKAFDDYNIKHNSRAKQFCISNYTFDGLKHDVAYRHLPIDLDSIKFDDYVNKS